MPLLSWSALPLRPSSRAQVNTPWPPPHFLLSREGDTAPHRTVAYTLVRRGESEKERWYLYRYTLNHSKLLLLYGTERPDDETVRAHVRRYVLAALADAEMSNPADAKGE